MLTPMKRNHALHVLRVQAGDTVNVFDDAGTKRSGAWSKPARTLSVSPYSTIQHSIPPCTSLWRRPSRKKHGLDRAEGERSWAWPPIVPLLSERTLVQVDEDSKKVERWREIALEACKQCGNNLVAGTFSRRGRRGIFCRNPARSISNSSRRLQPGAQPLDEILAGAAPRSVLILVGPEGDFTPAELGLAEIRRLLAAIAGAARVARRERRQCTR